MNYSNVKLDIQAKLMWKQAGVGSVDCMPTLSQLNLGKQKSNTELN